MSHAILALDTETYLMRQGRMVPPCVCVSWACGDQSGLLHQRDAEPWLHAVFDSDWHITTAFGAYDMAVLGTHYPSLWLKIWRAYDDGRIHDVLVRQKLQDLANGRYRGFSSAGKWIPLKYNLADVSHRYTKIRLAKGADTWRLRYAELDPLPLESWPPEACTYAVYDAIATLRTYEGQDERAAVDPNGPWYHANETDRVRADWWLHLTAATGIHTNRVAVDKLRGIATADLERLGGILREHHMLVNGIKKHKVVQARFQELTDLGQLELRWTVEKPSKPGVVRAKDFVPQIVTDFDACNESGDPLLETFAEYVSASKLLTSDCEAYARGVTLPLHTRFEVLAATGRTTSSAQKLDEISIGCNIQNIGTKAGLRECFVPRPGNVFIAADYDTAELRGLSQVCISHLGQSRLALILNAGTDPHMVVAAEMRGVPYDQALTYYKAEKKRMALLSAEERQAATATPERRTANVPWYMARQTGKVANFGFPGGLGAAKLVLYARKGYGVILTEDEARRLKQIWQTAYPEMREYFRLVESWAESDRSTFRVEQLFTKRLRSGTPFCAACNSPFQGLVADMALAAGYMVSHAMHCEPESPLYGAFMVNFVHDELIAECCEDRAADAAPELARLMCLGAAPYLPDVPPKASPVIMRYWSKSAEPRFDATGRMIPWPE